MSRHRIESRRDLQDEIERLKDLSKDQERKIRRDIHDIRESLKPLNILRSILESITGIKMESGDFRKSSLAAFLLLALKKFISKAETKAEDSIYLFLDRIFNSIRNFLAKYFNVRKHREEASPEREEL